jgi:pimeloyl-[acyl-carrier protein] methyl ester esterase
MVWLPGWSTGPDIWDREIERWPDAGHVTVDFSGCGTPGEIQDCADGAIAGADAGSLIVGWSLGAMAALQAVLRLGPPGARLALIGATGQFARTNGHASGWAPAALRRMQHRLAESPSEVLARFDRRLFSPAEATSGADVAWAESYGSRSPAVESLHAGLEFLQRFSITLDADKVQVPVSLLHGDADEICPPAGARQLAASLRNARLTIVTETGHALFWTRPEEFHEWLRSIP